MWSRYRHFWLGQVARALSLFAPLLLLLAPGECVAQASGRFDLNGPKVDVHVAREGKTLPIALVPNLQAGDRLTIHADLPPTQSVKLLLIVCFLRGPTNPPPDSWFTRIETWGKHIRAEGVTVTVPDEAQQALLFIAPETGGDFSTLKSAVRGRPGVFVRASQDLNEASFEQSRIERYIRSIRRVPPGSPEDLLDHSHKLAATLNLKPNDECFKRPADMQLACLRQSGNQVLLDDGHGQSLATMVTSGASADLIGSVAGTPALANTGSYSAYVGTVIDVVRLLSGLHTAQFQYIPAIAFPEEEALNLRLNTPPSFHNPKSVIVIALPAIQKAVLPPLRLQNPNHVACLLQPSTVLPLEGAPLVFATGFAHGLTLHLNGPVLQGRTDLPLAPDAFEGGLVVAPSGEERKPLEPSTSSSPRPSPDPHAHDQSAAGPSTSGAVITTGTVHGFWGFDTFDGPTIELQRLPGKVWRAEPQGEIIAGKTNQVLLRADGTACTQSVHLLSAGGESAPLQFKPALAEQKAEALEVKLPLDKGTTGGVTLDVQQFGDAAPVKLPLTAYSDAARPDSLHIHAGDTMATLLGTGLADVKSVEVAGMAFAPDPDQSPTKELRLTNAAASERKSKSRAPALKTGDHGTAHVTLNDGRVVAVDFIVDAPRPLITLLSKSVQSKSEGGPVLTLMDKDAIPLSSKFSFAVRSDAPARFPRSEKLEVATTDGSLHTTLQLADASLVLQDAKTALAFLNPAAAFGPSAFGPLQVRPVSEDGTVGDWQALGTLVRTPEIQAVLCGRMAQRVLPAPGTIISNETPSDTDASSASEPVQTTPAAPRHPGEGSCTLTGNGLFLIDSVGADSSFSQQSRVPIGYAEPTLVVPRPADNRTLYLRLRDDPDGLATLPAPSAAAIHRSGMGSSPQILSRRLTLPRPRAEQD